MNERRQPLAARVWGRVYRTWWPPDSPRHRKRAKRRSAKRERRRVKQETLFHRWLTGLLGMR